MMMMGEIWLLLCRTPSFFENWCFCFSIIIHTHTVCRHRNNVNRVNSECRFIDSSTLLFKNKTRSVNIVKHWEEKCYWNDWVVGERNMCLGTIIWTSWSVPFSFSLSTFVTQWIDMKRTNDRAAGVFLAGNLYLFSVLSKRAREVDEIKTYRLAAKLNNGESWLEQTSPYPKRRTKVPSE